MSNIIVAAGDLYTEIDVLACAIAYKELLTLQGRDSRAVLPGPLNKSITKSILTWPLVYDKSVEHVDKDSEFVVVDISEPAYLAKFVDHNRIIRLFDHHFGFEKYWQEKYGDKASIERVGACATQIFEEFEKAGLVGKISRLSANLLYTAIVSNTLYFKAAVTDKRDVSAFDKLKKFIDLPPNWIETYFREQSEFAMQHPYKAVKEDTITITTGLSHDLTIGQLELWDSKEFMSKYIDEAIRALESFGSEHWFLTSPSISEGVNYIYAENAKVKTLLEEILAIHFEGSLAKTDILVMRKEIKRLLNQFSKSH